jgi:trigger factor
MKITLDRITPVQQRVHVEIPPETVKEEFAAVFGKLGAQTKLKGFRPGKIPRSVLEGFYGQEVKREVLSRLVERSLREAVREYAVKVVSRPQVEVEADALEEGAAFGFSALLEVQPEIELKNYLGIELEKIKLSADDAQLDEALRGLQESHAQLVPVGERDRVRSGDFVLIDFVGMVDGKPFAGGSGQGYGLEIGSGKVLPGFEEGLVGLKKDEEHTMSVPYPENYPRRELAGKRVEFRVVVREIKEKVLPVLDDEFAKDHGECATLAELRERVRDRLQAELDQIQIKQLKEQLLARLIAENPFEVPHGLVEERIRHLLEPSRRDPASGAEVSLTTEAQNEVAERALRQVQAALLMEKIARVEKIDVPEQELEAEIDRLAHAAKEQGRIVREFYQRPERRDDLRTQLIFERALESVLERARIQEAR